MDGYFVMGTNYDDASYLTKTYKYNHEKYGLYRTPLSIYSINWDFFTSKLPPFLLEYFERKVVCVNSLKNSSIYISFR